AMTFHSTQDEIERGRALFEANCSNCSTDYFRDPSKMSSLSEVELARIIKEGNAEVQAFGENFDEEEVWAVAAYLRTLSFSDSSMVSASTPLASQNEPTSVSSTPVSAEETPAANATQAPVPGETQPGYGTVTGSIENETGVDLPTNLTITLRGFDHGTDPNSTPDEVLSLEGNLDENGTFTFETVEMPASRIFLAQTTHEGITFQSEFGVVVEGASLLTLSPIRLYGTTDDPSAIVIDDARIFFDYADNAIQVYGVYSFRNVSDKALTVELNDGVEIPFIKSPDGAQPLGFEPTQDSQPFSSINNKLAFPPSEEPYGLIVFASMQKGDPVDVTHSFDLPVASLTVFLPAGVSAEGSQLTDHGVQTMEGLNFQMYAAGDLPAGNTLTFTLSGTPSDSTTPSSSPVSETGSNRNILIGAGVLGLVLIAAGAWMFVRDRKPTEGLNKKEQDNDFDTPDEVMDAIIALDDLHHAKRISHQAYQKRRNELKDILKEMI
ncbi:MAG TPA: cytochrome c, partial [Anaerolineales bacterium]|nr:cytochrome c [Anaerolineales bacterium]